MSMENFILESGYILSWNLCLVTYMLITKQEQSEQALDSAHRPSSADHYVPRGLDTCVCVCVCVMCAHIYITWTVIHLIQLRDDENRSGSQNVGSFAVHPPGKGTSPKEF